MERKSFKKLKWIMVIIIITHLLCFFPNEMIPLPIIIVETELIYGYFKWNYTEDIISNFIITGQILAIAYLIFSTTNFLLAVGVAATMLMVISNIIWLIHKNVSVLSFEFLTSIPFMISLIIFWNRGFRAIVKPVE